MGCILSRVRRAISRRPSDDDPRIRLSVNYVALLHVFDRLPDAASLSAVAMALPRPGTPWQEALAAAHRARGRRAAPRLFRGLEPDKDYGPGGHLRILGEFCGSLKFPPGLAIGSSLLFARQDGLSYPTLAVPGDSIMLGVHRITADGKDLPTPKHAALFFPSRRDVAIIPFEVPDSLLSPDRQGQPLLPAIMGPHFEAEADRIKCLLLFVRLDERYFKSRTKLGRPVGWVARLLREVGPRAAFAGQEARFFPPGLAARGARAYGVILAGNGLECCSVAMDSSARNAGGGEAMRRSLEVARERVGDKSCALALGCSSLWVKPKGWRTERGFPCLLDLIEELLPG